MVCYIEPTKLLELLNDSLHRGVLSEMSLHSETQIFSFLFRVVSLVTYVSLHKAVDIISFD